MHIIADTCLYTITSLIFSITILCGLLYIRSRDKNLKDLLLILFPLTLQMGLSIILTYISRTSSFSLDDARIITLFATISTVLLTTIILFNLSRYLLRLLRMYIRPPYTGVQITNVALFLFLLLSFFFLYLFSKGDWTRTLPLTVNNYFSFSSALMIVHGFIALFHLKAAQGREEEALLRSIAISFLPLLILFPLDAIFLRDHTFKLGYTVFAVFSTQIYLYVSRHHFREYEADPGAIQSELFFGSSDLSDREKQVADLLIKGKTNMEIADALYISVNTVKSHIKSIYKKLGINNRMQLLCLIRNVEAGT